MEQKQRALEQYKHSHALSFQMKNILYHEQKSSFYRGEKENQFESAWHVTLTLICAFTLSVISEFSYEQKRQPNYQATWKAAGIIFRNISKTEFQAADTVWRAEIKSH